MINNCKIYEDRLIIESPIGLIRAEADAEKIIHLSFIDTKTEVISNQEFTTSNEVLNELHLQLNQYFNGERTNFSIKVQEPDTKFSREVLKLVSEISFGTTKSYRTIAEQLGSINSVRAVANANAKNQVLLLIPCHRVIGSDDSLTGYAGGLQRKKWLLIHELKTTNQAYQTELF